MPFRIRFSSNCSRDNGGFPTRCSTIATYLNFSAFLAPGGYNFDPSKKITEIVSTEFLMSFQLYFPRLSSPISFRVRRGGGGKIQAKVAQTPTRAQVKCVILSYLQSIVN